MKMVERANAIIKKGRENIHCVCAWNICKSLQTAPLRGIPDGRTFHWISSLKRLTSIRWAMLSVSDKKLSGDVVQRSEIQNNTLASVTGRVLVYWCRGILIP